MQPGRVDKATRVLVAPPGWDESKQGPCCSLPIRDEETAAGNMMVSAWSPSPEEIERIKAGAPVYLAVLGLSHPPVMVTVGDVPE